MKLARGLRWNVHLTACSAWDLQLEGMLQTMDGTRRTILESRTGEMLASARDGRSVYTRRRNAQLLLLAVVHGFQWPGLEPAGALGLKKIIVAVQPEGVVGKLQALGNSLVAPSSSWVVRKGKQCSLKLVRVFEFQGVKSSRISRPSPRRVIRQHFALMPKKHAVRAKKPVNAAAATPQAQKPKSPAPAGKIAAARGSDLNSPLQCHAARSPSSAVSKLAGRSAALDLCTFQ